MPEPRTQGATDRPEPAAAERTRGGAVFTPQVDIFENDKELILYADMPGVRPEGVDLRYERGELILHGRFEAPDRPGHVLLREYEDGDFYRVFEIHESIDSNRIEASCKNGVLTIRLPKAEAARPRQINVRGQ
jgi:HSP20 family protein